MGKFGCMAGCRVSLNSTSCKLSESHAHMEVFFPQELHTVSMVCFHSINSGTERDARTLFSFCTATRRADIRSNKFGCKCWDDRRVIFFCITSGMSEDHFPYSIRWEFRDRNPEICASLFLCMDHRAENKVSCICLGGRRASSSHINWSRTIFANS